jgi:hypothetical protein
MPPLAALAERARRQALGHLRQAVDDAGRQRAAAVGEMTAAPLGARRRQAQHVGDGDGVRDEMGDRRERHVPRQQIALRLAVPPADDADDDRVLVRLGAGTDQTTRHLAPSL